MYKNKFLRKLFYIFLGVLVLFGCGRKVAQRQRVEELCRIVFDMHVSAQVCDSVLQLAKGLSDDAQLDVLLEVIQATDAAELLERKEVWLAEAYAVAPEKRKVEVEICRIWLENAQPRMAFAQRQELRQRMEQLKSTAFTAQQQAFYLYVKVCMENETDLLRSWMWMRKALTLVRQERNSRMEIRLLEKFATVVQWAGDYESSISYWQEAYRLRKAGLFPVNEMLYATMLANGYAYMNNYPAAIEWKRKTLAQTPDNVYRKAVIWFEIADLYCRADSLPQALAILKETTKLPSSQSFYSKLYIRMADVFTASGQPDSAAVYVKQAVDMWEKSPQNKKLPIAAQSAYSGYAAVLWEKGKRKEAVEILEKVIVQIPRFGEDGYGDIYLEPYLKVLLQICTYYRTFGREQEAMELLFRRDSLRTCFVASNMWHQNKKLTEQYRNQELKARIELQLEQLARSRQSLLLISGLCIALTGLALVFWMFYRQKQKRLNDLFKHQKEVERLTQQAVLVVPDSPEKELFIRLEKMVLQNRLFRDPDLTLDYLCPLVGSNRTYISACVNKFANTNFSNWLNKLRVNYIIAAISEGRTNFTELFVEAGFSSVTSFYRHFKLVTQMSPKQYLECQRRKLEPPAEE